MHRIIKLKEISRILYSNTLHNAGNLPLPPSFTTTSPWPVLHAQKIAFHDQVHRISIVIRWASSLHFKTSKEVEAKEACSTGNINPCLYWHKHWKHQNVIRASLSQKFKTRENHNLQAIWRPRWSTAFPFWSLVLWSPENSSVLRINKKDWICLS